MAKKSSSSASAAKKAPAAKATKIVADAPIIAASDEIVSVTPVRNTAVPPRSAAIAAPVVKAGPTHDDVRLAAYFLWQSNGGGEFENWIAAERSLNAT